MQTATTANRVTGPRCIALVGPFQSGKTTLLEAILARTGGIRLYRHKRPKLSGSAEHAWRLAEFGKLRPVLAEIIVTIQLVGRQ